jgi:hypothetical protein
VAASGVDIPAGGADGSTLDLAGMPAFLRQIVESAYGASTGDIFLVATGISLVGLVVVLFLPRVHLRDTVDMVEETPEPEPRHGGSALSA